MTINIMKVKAPKLSLKNVGSYAKFIIKNKTTPARYIKKKNNDLKKAMAMVDKKTSPLSASMPYGIGSTIKSGFSKLGAAIKPHLTVSNALKVGKFAIENRHAIGKITGLSKHVPFGQSSSTSKNIHVPSHLIPMTKNQALNQRKKKLYAIKNAKKELVRQQQKDFKLHKSKSTSFFNTGISKTASFKNINSSIPSVKY